MIRKSKNNEDKPDFEKMWGEVEENIQVKDAEQNIVSRVSMPSYPWNPQSAKPSVKKECSALP